MVFNATFNNISVISWQSVLLVEETGVPQENHRHVSSYSQTSSLNVVSSTPRHEGGSNSQL
jgi:predicted Zn-dependent protease